MIDELLNKYQNNEKRDTFVNYNLQCISKILQLLGSPQKNFPCVHIAGTNGKGTTSWVLSSILENSGYKTGLYTSPHLVSINERIRINSNPVHNDNLIRIIRNIEALELDKNNLYPTYFDILTICAFIHFSEEHVDIAVIETGLGGRLDSTNVISPLLTIITDISYDHTAILGCTIDQIAAEKAGIIKYKCPVITSNTVESGLKVIAETAEMFSSELISLGSDFFYYNVNRVESVFCFNYRFREYEFNDIKISLFPEHQVKNCSLAITAALCLVKENFNRINPLTITGILPQVNVPGRFELLCPRPAVYYDPAHNISGLGNLLSHIETVYKTSSITLIVTLMKDKATPDLIELLTCRSYPVIYFLLNDSRVYVPPPGQFELITGEQNVILQRIVSDNNSGVYFFTGTFRNYQSAKFIAESLKEI